MKFNISIFALLALLVAFSFAHAATENPFSASVGGYVASGSVYLDADATQDSTFSLVQGIANITEIRDPNGDLIWVNDASDLNIVFQDFSRDLNLESDDGNFMSNGGRVEFYENSSGTFDPTGNFTADSAKLNQGELKIGAVGADFDGEGHSAQGTATDLFYSSNGFLNIENGAWKNLLATNSFGFADMAFNISASTVATAGYTYAGSGDVAGEISAVPLPAGVWLFGSAILAMGGFVRKRD
jgi:hypothetical protein